MKDRIRSAITGIVLAGTAACVAQTHKVGPASETVVRAVGVYEWTGDLSKPTGSRFVPVTLFINGDLEDAGLYKPQPVPFALLSGNVYELQDAGLPKGDLVLETALNARLPDGAPGPVFDEGWTAYGTYKPPAASKPVAHLRPSKNLPVIQVSGGDASKPHLTNKSGNSSAGKNTDSSQGPETKPEAGTGSSDTTTSSDPDRPTMHRRTAPDDTAGNNSGSGSSTTDSSNDPADRPTLKRRSPEEEKAAKEQKKKNDIATVTAAGSLNDDPDRPRLHHGGGKADGDTEPPKLMGIPKDMHQMVAVSDAKDRDTHPFARSWEDLNERAAILAKMQGFARAKLAAYGVVPGVTPPSAIAGVRTAPAKGTISGTTPPDSGPPTLKRGVPEKSSVSTEDQLPMQASLPSAATNLSKTTAKRTGAKGHHAAMTTSPVPLVDEELKGYTLSYGGAPTYVYMAHTLETGAVMRYVTIVAQDNGMGELKIALASVTDAAHLDRTPWMRLVDAVDVEASNRASLLFELRGQSSRQFALYRVIAAKSEQIFPEGNAM